MVELLVHMVLLGVLLSAVYSVFTLCLRYSRTAQAKMDLQNAMQTVFLNLNDELSQSDFSSVAVTNSSSQPGIVFASAISNGSMVFDPAGSGKPQWQKWVGYWVDTTKHQLFRNEQAMTPTLTVPLKTSAPSLSSFTSLAHPKLVASNLQDVTQGAVTLSSFSATTPSTGSINFITVSATSVTTVNSTNDLVLQMTDDFYCRN